MFKNIKIVGIGSLLLYFSISNASSNINKYLYRAASRGDIEYLTKLIKDKKADVNYITSTGKTPLMAAVLNGRNKIVRDLLLIKNKDKKLTVNYNHVDNKGETALHKAARKNNATVIKMLLLVDADENKQNRYGDTALHLAAKEGNLAIVKKLLGHKADIKIRNNKGNTALHEAARANRKNVVELLIKSGANIYTKNNKCRMPVDDSKYAVKKLLQNPQILKKNVEKDKDTCKKDK